ncbi:MAG: M20 family metallopeptidase [Firmicutes bacterium]|nr:M20 family metallopeptidase [Bacillota bacterium]
MSRANELKMRLKENLSSLKRDIEGISNFLFLNPELSGQEYLASAYLSEFMITHGFSVDKGYCGFETAFRAEYALGNGDGPTIAFLAEYDALPLSGHAMGHEALKKTNKAGHICGHNWIAAATVGVSVCLSRLSGINGRIVLIGTPAEETIGCKVDMIKAGAFDDIDVVIQPHLESFTDINCTALALDAVEFRFFGKATHAASYPHLGINALDAVQLMFSGVNALRQQLRDDVKICGIVTSGGEASNIIPDYASCRYTVRSSDRKYLNEVTRRVINCAKGAELMTGARMEYGFFENQTDDILNIDLLQNLLKINMVEAGVENIRENAIMPTGSSDIGNVSQVCPTMYFEINIESDKPFFTHDPVALEYVDSDYAYIKLDQVIRIMGGMAIQLFEDAEMVEAVKKRHIELRTI